MRDYDEIKDEGGYGGGWMTLPNILAGIILIFFLFLALGLKYIASDSASETTVPTTKPTTVSTATTPDSSGTSETSDVSLEELLERERILDEKMQALKEIAQVRERIISELKSEMALTGLQMVVDDTTGDIRLSEALLFAVSVDTVSRAGENYLRIFVPTYMAVVLSPENKPYIEQIVIEGHTDDEGTYLNNLALSQRRAVSVATFIFRNNLNLLPDGEAADKYFAISGRSFAMLVEEGGAIDKALSRRVEFKFRLKDDELIKQMTEIYEGVD